MHTMPRLLTIASLVFVAALSPATAHVNEAQNDTVANVDTILQRVIARGKIPGMAAVVLRGDRIIAQGVAGVRKKGGVEPITLNDEFHLGSCTKAMTATLTAMLIEEGKLKWSTTLGELFGDTVKNMNPAWRAVTVQQVLAHRAGLPRWPGPFLYARLCFSKATPQQQRQMIAEHVLSKAPQSAPGKKFAYSNVGYVLIGEALEKITGRTWEDLMRERLFTPLGIKTGGFGPPGIAHQVDQPWGHLVITNWSVDPGSWFAEMIPAYGPAGQAHMAITDWAKFIAMHLRGDPENPHRNNILLSSDSFAQLHVAAPGEDYFAGWQITTRKWAEGARAGDTGRVLTHAGSNERWYCVVWVAPEIDFAVLVTCNRGVLSDHGGFKDLTAANGCDEVAGALVRAFALKP